jgi:hypothetical protein
MFVPSLAFLYHVGSNSCWAFSRVSWLLRSKERAHVIVIIVVSVPAKISTCRSNIIVIRALDGGFILYSLAVDPGGLDCIIKDPKVSKF